jgi:hypothetical protein
MLPPNCGHYVAALTLEAAKVRKTKRNIREHRLHHGSAALTTGFNPRAIKRLFFAARVFSSLDAFVYGMYVTKFLHYIVAEKGLYNLHKRRNKSFINQKDH